MKFFHSPESSHIEHFGHDKGVMSVKFKNSAKVYKWLAPETEFHAMKKAPSAGEYLHVAKKGWKPL